MNTHRAALSTVALALIVMLAAGCLSSPPANSPTPVADTSFIPTQQAVIRFVALSSQQEHYQALAQAFETQNPTIRVQLLDPLDLFPSGKMLESRERMKRLVTSADVFMASDQDLAWLRDSGLIKDLKVLQADDHTFEEKDFYAGLLARFESKSKLWGVPAGVCPRVMFYRPDLFERAGLDEPQLGWTWEDFLARAQALTNLDASPPVYGFAERRRYELDTWVYQYGATFTQPPGEQEAFFEDPRVQQAINWYLDLARVHRVMPGPDSPDAPGSATSDPIASRRVAMWIDYLPNLPTMQADGLGIVPLPRNQIQASLPQVDGYFISAAASDPQACWRWISYLTRQLPEWGTLPVRHSVAGSEAYQQAAGRHLAEISRYILGHDQLALAPRQHNWFVETYDWLVNKGVVSVLEDQTTVGEMLSEAQQRALTALGLTIEPEAAPVSPPAMASPSPPSAVTLSFFTLAGAAEYPRLARAFEAAHPGIKIQVKIPQGSQSMDDLVRTMDVFQIFGGVGGGSQVNEYLLALAPLLSVADPTLDLDDFYPQALDAFRWEGSLRGLPVSMDARMLFFNQDMFDEAGVAYPQPDWTWDDFLAAAVQLTESESHRYGFVSYDGEWVDDVVLLAFQRGGRLVDNLIAPTAPTLDDPAMVEAMRWYADLQREHEVMPPPYDPFEDGMMEGWALVLEGRAAMWIGDVAGLPPGGDLPFRLGIVPLPIDKEPATVFSISGYALSPQRPNAEASWKWLQFISQQAAPIDFWPARRSLLSQVRFNRMPPDSQEALRQTYLTIMEKYRDASYAQVAGTVPWYDDVYQLFAAAAQDVIEQGEDPALMLTSAQQQALQIAETLSSP